MSVIKKDDKLFSSVVMWQNKITDRQWQREKKEKEKSKLLLTNTQKKEIKTDNETVYTVVCCLEKSTDNFV